MQQKWHTYFSPVFFFVLKLRGPSQPRDVLSQEYYHRILQSSWWQWNSPVCKLSSLVIFRVIAKYPDALPSYNLSNLLSYACRFKLSSSVSKWNRKVPKMAHALQRCACLFACLCLLSLLLHAAARHSCPSYALFIAGSNNTYVTSWQQG